MRNVNEIRYCYLYFYQRSVPVTEQYKALVLEEEMDDTLQYELIPVNNMTEGRIIYY